MLLFCSGFNGKRRAAGLRAGSRRQELQQLPLHEPSTNTPPAPWLQAPQGKGQPGAGITRGWQRSWYAGCCLLWHPSPPSPELCRAASRVARRLAHRSCQCCRALPGGQQVTPWLSHLVQSHQRCDELKGAELLVCFGQQRWVVTQGMGCDTGDCPVFPCSLQQQRGEDSHPGLLSLMVGGRTSLFVFIILSEKSQLASGVMEVVGLAEARLGVAELKLKLVSWLATAFCGAQRCVMPASLHAI